MSHNSRMEMRPSMPIGKGMAVELGHSSRKFLSELANKILRDDPALCATNYFGDEVICDLDIDGPALLMADQSEIPLFGSPEETLMEYRMAVLCQPGDMLVLSHDRSEGFESYLRDYLNISDFDVLVAEAKPQQQHWSLPKRCVQNALLFRKIAQKASLENSLSIIPYISTGHIWNLGRCVFEETSKPIAIAAPPPRLAKHINDKVWFSYWVEAALGQDALTPAYVVYGPSTLAGYVKRLAHETERLVIKIPDSAGSIGNLSLEAASFRGQSLQQIKNQLLEMLDSLGWSGTFPLKIEIWETPTLSSPSAQIWIPRPENGLPIIEGIFEQVVEGSIGKFVGAVKSQMPDAVREQMVEQAMSLAFLFQRLGYFGRCSLDALLIGNEYENATLHWIECNGRWGGVSIPMTFFNRIVPDPNDYEIMIVQKFDLSLPERPFAEAVKALDGLLFHHEKVDEGLVMLTPTSFEHGCGLHFMTIAKSLGKARKLASHAIERLTNV